MVWGFVGRYKRYEREREREFARERRQSGTPALLQRLTQAQLEVSL